MNRKPKLHACPGYHSVTYRQEPHNCSPGAFYPDPARRGGGRSYRCRDCHNAASREYFQQRYYPANRETLIENVIQRRKA